MVRMVGSWVKGDYVHDRVRQLLDQALVQAFQPCTLQFSEPTHQALEVRPVRRSGVLFGQLDDSEPRRHVFVEDRVHDSHHLLMEKLAQRLAELFSSPILRHSAERRVEDLSELLGQVFALGVAQQGKRPARGTLQARRQRGARSIRETLTE